MIGQATCVNSSMYSNGHGFWLRLGLRSLRTKLSLQTRPKISKNFLTRGSVNWSVVCKDEQRNSISLLNHRQMLVKGECMQISTPVGDALERYLNLSSLELKLTAQNMANIDTPGYRAQGFDFAGEMERSLGELTADQTKNGVVRKPFSPSAA